MIGKRGMTLPWLVGTILAVFMAMIVVDIWGEYYAASQYEKRSFNELVAKIETLEEGETVFLTYMLADDSLLVSFTNGENFVGEKRVLELVQEEATCVGTVTVPKACGTAPCLCLCHGSFRYGFEDACVEDAVDCHPFTGEEYTELTFADTDCDYGVSREGPESGRVTIYLKKTDGELWVCSDETCVTEEYEEVVAKFQEMTKEYQSCLEASADCACSLDFSFIANTYAVHFYLDKVDLWKIGPQKVVFSEPLTTNIGVLGSETFRELAALYTFSRLEEVLITGGGVAVAPAEELLVVSPTIEGTVTSGTALTENQVQVQKTLYHKEGKMYFTSEDLSTVPSCTVLVA